MFCVKCAAEIPDSATSHLCPACAAKAGGKRQLYWSWGSFFMCGAAVAFIVFLIAIVSDSNSQQPSAPQTVSSDSNSQPASTSSQLDTSIQAPKDESEFVSMLNSFVARYGAAPNEFQKSDLRADRTKAIAVLLPNLSIQNWVGKISSMQTLTSDSGTLDVELAGDGQNDFRVEDLSIPHGSLLYNQVANLAQGDEVFFSGRFTSGLSDYIEEFSLTEEGSMTEPEFAFTFTSIGKQPAPPETTAASSPPPEASKGWPFSEETFVDAYVLANIGRDDLDKDQLEQLAHDEYRMGKQVDTRILVGGGMLFDTRANRAMDYLGNLQRQQPPAPASPDSNSQPAPSSGVPN